MTDDSGAGKGTTTAARTVVVVVGASARAASYAVARAGLEPWWIDRFGDVDLAARFPGERVARYPAGLPAAVRRAPPGPVLVTGAMENHPRVLAAIAAGRELLGSDADVCRRVRDPAAVASALARAGLPAAPLRDAPPPPEEAGRWLVKPRAGAGGAGIAPWSPGAAFDPARQYLQRRIEGAARSALYLADGRRCRLVGVSVQLVGEPALSAPPFAWCGNIGPLAPADAERARWQAIGEALVAAFGLRGLFGVDAVHGDAGPVAVEVNPRYTGSAELYEAAGAVPLAGWLCTALKVGVAPGGAIARARRCLAKGVLYAPCALEAPADAQVLERVPVRGVLGTADLPPPGTRFRPGEPLCTVLLVADDEAQARTRLAEAAGVLYERFLRAG